MISGPIPHMQCNLPSPVGIKVTKPAHKSSTSVEAKYRRSELYAGVSSDNKSIAMTSASSSIFKGRKENASQTRNCLRSCGLVLCDRLLSYIPSKSLGRARSCVYTARGLRHFNSSAICNETHRNLAEHQRVNGCSRMLSRTSHPPHPSAHFSHMHKSSRPT